MTVPEVEKMATEHRIDLSVIPHRPGQSEGLEARRKRAWDTLTESERPGVIEAYGRPVTNWEMPCIEAGGVYERTLYALVVLWARLTPGQIGYMLIARWHKGADQTTIRTKLALMVSKGHARWTRDGRYYATEEGAVFMRAVETAWAVRQRAAMRERRVSERRGPVPQPDPRQGTGSEESANPSPDQP